MSAFEKMAAILDLVFFWPHHQIQEIKAHIYLSMYVFIYINVDVYHPPLVFSNNIDLSRDIFCNSPPDKCCLVAESHVFWEDRFFYLSRCIMCIVSAPHDWHFLPHKTQCRIKLTYVPLLSHFPFNCLC